MTSNVPLYGATGDSHNTKPNKETLINQAAILALKNEGYSEAEIGKELGLSTTYVRRLYDGALQYVPVEDIEKHRTLELSRLEAMHREIFKVLMSNANIIQGGRQLDFVDNNLKLSCVDKLIKVMERKARLLGLDKPYTVKVTMEEKPRPLADFYAAPASH